MDAIIGSNQRELPIDFLRGQTMAIEQDFVLFYKSISAELRATQDRVRDLIGSSHWGTDGAHREIILRKIL